MIVKITHQETVYQGRAFTVRRDEVSFPNQYSMQLDIVQHPGAVTILPVDEAGNILFVRQYRHATGKELLELPAGTLNAAEPPETCARREIREETGFAAENMVKLGEFFLAPGYSTEYMHVYLATGLYNAPLPGDQDEFLSLEPIPIEKAYQMAIEGKLQDGKSLAALLLAREALKQTR
jgi:ADP-ribose pyrophosphatase